MSKYFDLLQEGERLEAEPPAPSPLPQLPAGDDLLALELPYLPTTRALTTIPRPRILPEPKRHFTVGALVEGCFRYRYRFLTVAGLITLATLAAVIFSPRRYQATMQLRALSPSQYASASGDTQLAAALAPDLASGSPIDVPAQANLLRSRDLLSQALAFSGPDAIAPAEREKAIDDLARQIKVTVPPASETMQVSLAASSPEQATELLQAIASAFVSRQLSLLRPSHARLVAIADESQRQLLQAQQSLERFKQSTGLASAADYEAAIMHQLDGYAANAASLAAKLAEARRLRGIPTEEGLKARAALLEGRRIILLERHQADDPLVLAVDQQIAAVKDRLMRGPADPNTVEGRTQLAEHNSIDAQKRVYVAKLNQLESQSEQLERLEKQVTANQKNLDEAVANREQAIASDTRDHVRLLPAVLAARPSAISLPVQPRPVLYLSLGLPSALLLALLLCGVSEMTRSTVCSPRELDALTGVSTLGTLPVQPAEDGKRSRRNKPSRHRSSQRHGDQGARRTA